MERDLDSEKPRSSGWHIALDRQDVDPDEAAYLGDPETITSLLASFNSDVIERQKQVQAGSMQFDAAMGMDKEACYRMADILLGKVRGFTPIGAWNVDGEIATHAAAMLGLQQGPDPRETIAAAWGMHLYLVYGAAEQAADGAPDEAWQASINSANNLMRAVCLGLNRPDAEDLADDEG